MGASTDDIATMNAERAGVVYCSPNACVANPDASSSVSSAPARSSARENPARRLTSGARTSVAIVKRVARKSRGEAAASASLTITKRSEEHTSELQSLAYLVCRLLLEKKKKEKHYWFQVLLTDSIWVTL